MARINLIDLIEDEITATEETISEGWIWGDQSMSYTQDEADDIRTKAWEKLQERVSRLIEDEKVSIADLPAARTWLHSNVRWLDSAEIDAAWEWAAAWDEDAADMIAPVLLAA